jgi:formyltetrahydrofolate-dependent phosphoribosylglycinamide formyltransferase
MARLVVMVSGSGTNLQAIINAIAERRLPAEIVLVVSNRKSAYALTRAANAGIPTLYYPFKPYLDNGQTRSEYDRDLAQKVSEAAPDLIVLAGWMHVLSEAFLNRFPDRVLNLHPALPGAFPGTNAIARAYEAYRQGEIEESGCMVHYVVPEVDAGPVIAQKIVRFEESDTLETFEMRMHEAEHQLIVEALVTILYKP